MRELKFRAWNKRRKEWHYESSPELLTYYGFHIFGECTLMCPPMAGDLQYLEITQYTGLKDKNDTDMCAKDIVTLDLLKGRKISTIEIHDQWEIPVVNFFGYHEPLYLYAGKNENDTCIEVIGNFYENKELLDE